MKARDLMSPLSKYLEPDFTLREAADLLGTARWENGQIGEEAMPVLDSKGKLIGILSIGDILKVVYPKYMHLVDSGSSRWNEIVETLANKMTGRKVRDFMTQIVITVKEDSTLMECMDHMLKNNVKRVPVLDRGNRVVGMLHERDIFYCIAEAVQNNNLKAQHEE
ncbi:MAG: CBS domain-containing protein, partial [Nitrospirota bacterium]